jgi:pimeloyl-ACP methyl ester carboxylesterase
MNYVTYQGKELAYELEGKGTTVLLLHGFCEDSNMWEDFYTDLLEEDYQVLRIDLPGFGQSEPVADISIEDMAKGVQAVLKETGCGPLVFIGHSMGGYVGLSFARLYPEHLLGLGLFHSHPYEDSEEKRATRLKSVEFIRRQGHVLFVKQLLPNLFTPNFASSNAFLLEKLIYRASKFPSEGIVAAQLAMAHRPDQAATLEQIEVPVLFILGKEDTAVPSDKSLAQTHLPKTASIHLLEKVGHMGMFEARKQTQRIVRQFVDFCEEKAAD